jgi:hypothetical protein
MDMKLNRSEKWFQNLRLGSRAKRKTPEASCVTYEKAQHTRLVCEHFEEVCNAAIGP